MARAARRIILSIALVALVSAGAPLSATGAGPGSKEAGDEAALRAPAGATETPRLAPIDADRLARAKGRSEAGAAGGADRTTPSAPGPNAISHVTGAGFDGVDDLHTFSPSDSTGALGSTWWMGAVNSDVSVFDPSSGAEQPGFPLRLKKIPGVVPTGYEDFDPKVVYDHYDGRFVLVFLAADKLRNTSKVKIVIVTAPDATADDTATWCSREINGDQVRKNGLQLADYPSVGFTDDRVTISTNNFPSFTEPGFNYAQLVSIPKTSLYDPGCGALSKKVFSGKQTRTPDGSKGFTIQPAQTYGGVAPDVQYLLSFQVSFQGIPKGEKLIVWRIRKTSNGVKLANAQKNVGNAIIPPFGTQEGGSEGQANTWWDTGDLRLINAAYDASADRIYAAHAVEKDIGSGPYIEAAIRWYEVDPAGDLSGSQVPRKGILGVEDRDQGWPAIVTDAAGNLFITYSQAGVLAGGEFLSAYATRVPPASTTEDSPLLLVSGEARYEASAGDVERWGDYNAINRDPDSSQVAIANQYAILDAADVCGDGGSRTCLWQQWLDLVEDV